MIASERTGRAQRWLISDAVHPPQANKEQEPSLGPRVARSILGRGSKFLRRIRWPAAEIGAGDGCWMVVARLSQSEVTREIAVRRVLQTGAVTGTVPSCVWKQEERIDVSYCKESSYRGIRRAKECGPG